MDYGYFDDAHKEYVITNPRTPVKWINYIGSLAFGGFVDNTGGALICKGDPSLDRITRYYQQLPASEFKGETLYLRIHLEQGYRVFSPFFVPTLDDFDRFECRVGLDYTRFITEFYGLRCEVTVFVPPGEACEVRDACLTNISSSPLVVDAIPVVEYTHPNAVTQLTNSDWVPQTMVSKAVHDPGGLVTLIQYPFMYRDTQVNYFTSNLPVASYETDRGRFLGSHEYGTWAKPESLTLAAGLSCYEAQRGDNIAALHHPLGLIQPGESRRLITLLGQAASLGEARPVIDRYRQSESVERALAGLANQWEDTLSQFKASTPDPAMDTMVNIHNPRQCSVTRNWSRYLSYYQLGLGTRGIGFRDSSQDVLATFAQSPVDAKALIEQLLSVQKRNGSAMHQFNPISMIASEGDSLERDDRPHYYSDDHLWIVLAVCSYLKETGDWGFLEKKIPYYEKDKQGSPLETGTVREHQQRALEFTHTDTGGHGLPHLGFADWNDTVNLPTGAESIFTANLYGKALREMIDLAVRGGDEPLAGIYRQDYAAMQRQVNSQAWDGEWYVAYFDADGAPLGSRTNAQGQIYLNSQSWGVISGFATPERTRACLDTAYERLNTRYGIKISAPGYNGFDPRQGGITTYPPGAKENGGIFLHTNPWMMIAEALAGNGERAYQYYCQINPARQNDRLDEYECEPYVYAQNILGDEHLQFGLARNSWLTGTASWVYQAATQYILGVRPEYDGLRIEPCIPLAWEEFRVQRKFRGASYAIRVHNPGHVCSGVKSIALDGKPISGTLIPVLSDGTEHQVEVVLG
ncbi:MAG: glycosyl transferase [Chloroflexi bacterium]|nr:glycosyl transferase [Chloroflexota bacterium]